MAKPTITTRASKGSALTWTEGDQNLENLRDATITIKAGTEGTDVVSDLNGTVTLVAGTNVTLTGDNTAKTVTINSTASGGATDLNGLTDVDYSGAGIQTGDILKWTSGPTGGYFTNATNNLSGLSDVKDMMSPNSGDILAWNSTNNQWENSAPTSSVNDLNDLTDVSYSQAGIQAGQILKWNVGAGYARFENYDNNLSGLSDVKDMMTPGNGDVLTWNSTNNQWENTAPSSGGDLNFTKSGDAYTAELTSETYTSSVIYKIPYSSTALDISAYSPTNTFLGGISINGSGTVSLANSVGSVSVDDTNLTLTPPSTGNVVIDNLTWPGTSGTSGQVLTTDGSNTLSWTTVSSGITVTDDTATNATRYLVFEDVTSGTVSSVNVSSTKLTFNPSTGTLSTTILNGATLNGYKETVYTITYGATITPNWSNGTVQKVTLTGGATFAAPTNMVSGSSLTLIIYQDATGGRTGSWNASYKFAGGAPTLSTTASAVDVVNIFYDGTNYLASISKQDNSSTVTGLAINAQGELRLADSDSSNYVGFKSPATVSANKVWTLPSADGTNGQVLSTNGSGVLSWATAGGGGTPFALVGGTITYQEFTGLQSTAISETTLPHTWSELSDPNGLVTVSGDNVTISAAGTYLIEYDNGYSCNWYASNISSGSGARSLPTATFKLYNSTDATTIAIDYLGGHSNTVYTVSSFTFSKRENHVTMAAIVTIASAKTFNIRYAIEAAASGIFTTLKLTYTYSPSLPKMKITKLA